MQTQTVIQNPIPNDELSNLIDLKTMSQRYPQLGEQSLRWSIARRKVNGLADSGAIFKFGRRWFFNIEKFTTWMQSQ